MPGGEGSMPGKGNLLVDSKTGEIHSGGTQERSGSTYDTGVALGSIDVNTTAASARIVGAGVHGGSDGFCVRCVLNCDITSPYRIARQAEAWDRRDRKYVQGPQPNMSLAGETYCECGWWIYSVGGGLEGRQGWHPTL